MIFFSKSSGINVPRIEMTSVLGTPVRYSVTARLTTCSAPNLVYRTLMKGYCLVNPLVSSSLSGELQAQSPIAISVSCVPRFVGNSPFLVLLAFLFGELPINHPPRAIAHVRWTWLPRDSRFGRGAGGANIYGVSCHTVRARNQAYLNDRHHSPLFRIRSMPTLIGQSVVPM